MSRMRTLPPGARPAPGSMPLFTEEPAFPPRPAEAAGPTVKDPGKAAEVTFTVPGKPSAWQRAQRVGKRTFNLASMVAAQHAIASAAAPSLCAPFGPDFDGPVTLDVVATFELPKSWSKKKRAALLGQPHTQKPDASNLAKNCEDALNEVAYRDDAQVCETRCRKVWGERSGTVVTLRAIGDAA